MTISNNVQHPASGGANPSLPATPTQLPEQTHEWEGEGGNVPQTDPTVPKEHPHPLEPLPASEDPAPLKK